MSGLLTDIGGGAAILGGGLASVVAPEVGIPLALGGAAAIAGNNSAKQPAPARPTGGGFATWGRGAQGNVPVNTTPDNSAISNMSAINGAGGSTGTGGASATDPQTVAYYNSLINMLNGNIGTLQGSEGTLMNNITQAANDQQNQLNQQETNAETGYNNQIQQQGQSRAQNINSVDQNARNNYNALIGILNAAGSGGSSAALYGMPEAVAQNATTQRAGVDQAYNQNLNNITSAETTTKQQYKNALQDLLTQENSQKGQALQSVLGQIGQLQQDVANANIDKAQYGGESYAQAQARAAQQQQAANDTQHQLAQIFQQYSTPTFNVTPVTPTTANTTAYSVDPTTIKANAANPGTDQSMAAYLSNLNKQQNNNGNVLTGATPTSGSGSAVAATAGAAR